MRKGKVSLAIIVSFFVGIVVGIIVSLSIGAVLYYLEPDTLLPDHPKTFGDIGILVENYEEDEEPNKIMLMTKNKIPFFYADQNKDRKVTEIAIVGKNESIRLTMKATEEPSGWKNVTYGCVTADYTKGERYFDINFDGQFDVKYFFDDTGALISKHIYLDKAWEKVERLEKGKAILDQKTYVFSNDSGWTIHQ